MKLRGDLVITREGNAVRMNEGLDTEVLAADKALVRFDNAWKAFDAGGALRVVELPDATTLPNGWKVVVHNVSTAGEDIEVRDYDGTFTGTLMKAILAPIAPNDTLAYQFVLIDNATAAGVWYVIELGDSAQAAAVKFVANFVIADFPAASGGRRELTSTQVAGLGAATHGRGANPVYILQEKSGTDHDRVLVDRERMSSAGNLAIRVSQNDSFDGRVIFV